MKQMSSCIDICLLIVLDNSSNGSGLSDEARFCKRGDRDYFASNAYGGLAGFTAPGCFGQKRGMRCQLIKAVEVWRYSSSGRISCLRNLRVIDFRRSAFELPYAVQSDRS
jgi:hypothetical protein